MLKYLIYPKVFSIIIITFLIGCSSIGHKAGPTPQKKLFTDQEIAAFMEGDSSYEIKTNELSRGHLGISSERPIWAKEQFLSISTKNYIARAGYSKIGNRRRQDVSDSLRDKIREKLARDIKTRVEQERMDSLSVKIVEQGKQKAAIREHISKVISRHYSNIVFDGIYDESSQWIDPKGDTLWYFIKYNKTKYLLEEQQRIVDEIVKAGTKAYRNLKTSFKALSLESDVEKALSTLGAASYYISKGGGSAIEDDLFHFGGKQNLIFQRHELIKEIDKSIEIDLINNNEDKIATRNRPYTARVKIQTNKDYSSNKVKLRIQTDSDKLQYDKIVKVNRNGNADITFSTTQNISDQIVNVTITFDVISELIPDKEWYTTDDYKDLLKELPKKSFKIKIKEFAPLRTWVFIHTNVSNVLSKNENYLQGALEKELGRIPELFNVVPSRNWPVDYKKVQAYKSGEIQFKDLGSDKMEIQNHDIDLMLELNKDGNDKYTLTLSGTNPDLSGGIMSTNLEGILLNDINKNLRTLVDKFVNDYFYRKIQLTLPVNSKVGDMTFQQGSKKLHPKQVSDHLLELSGFSRFQRQELIAKSVGFRQQKFTVDGEPFNLSMIPNPTSVIKIEPLIHVQGTLRITVLDSLTGKPVLYGRKGQGLPPVIKVRKWYGFFPDPFKSLGSNVSHTATFPIDELGKYYVSVTKQHYGSPFPKIITVYDDNDFEHNHLNNIRFSLQKQPIGPAIAKSTIVPGWGQWSLGKKKESISFFVGTVITGLWGGYNYYKYDQEKDNYKNLKEIYLESKDEWLTLEDDLNDSREDLMKYRKQLYGSFAATGLIWSANIITVTW